MALCQPTSILWEYISVAAVTGTQGSALTAGHLEKPQVTKGSCPFHSASRGCKKIKSQSKSEAAYRPAWSLVRSHFCVGAVECNEAAIFWRETPTKSGRLSGSHRQQAGSHRGAAYTHASHHSSGRALARLQLLILIHPPPRQAEWRRLSGGGRVAPCGEAAHIERRSSRSRPEAMPPDECRSEGTPSSSEGPYVRGETFWFLLCRLTKGTRRKGETISRRYRSNGYVLNQPISLVGPEAAKA